jgi:hypothetical protein
MSSPLKRKAPDHIEDFVPEKKVLVQINKTNLYVYPNVTPEMGNNERSLAFNINKTALVNARSIPFNQKLNHMGKLLGCSNIIDIERTVYKNAAFNFLKINTNLTALSYHNAQGGIVNDALDAAGTLKPIANGPVNACRPESIFSRKVRTTINLAPLDPSITPIPTSFFFLRLPVTDHIVVNASGNNRTLHTFDGPSNWLTGNQAAFTTLIYSHPDTIHEPFDLVAPDFTAPEAIIDIKSRVNKIEEDTSKASWQALLAKILHQVCLNFLNDPYKTLSRVHQHTIIDRNSVTQTVRQYHNQIQLVISTFDKSVPSWPANPFRTFMDNLSPEIKNKVEQTNFRLHTQTVSTSPHDQVNLIQDGYEAASLAEKELAENRNFIRNELSSAHGFLAIPGLPPGLPPQPLPMPSRRQQQRSHASSFMSPAETMISGKMTPACAGCGDPSHMYYDKRTKTILCPKRDQPEVQA